MSIGIAGAPQSLIAAGDYFALFEQMRIAGITLFNPNSLTQELPTVEGLGAEVDVFPPPWGTATPALYEAMRANGVKLVVSADVMYPLGQPLPSAEADPLRALIDAAGRDLVHAVYGYDEAALNAIPVATSAALRAHLQAIDPTLPVIQIHAMLDSTAQAADDYLALVRAHGAYADQIGFAVYPFAPQPGATSPYSNGAVVDPYTALSDYARWLEAFFPDKAHVGVLQGFGFADLYSPALRETLDPALVQAADAPSLAELHGMIEALGSLDSFFWYGPSYQTTADAAIWQDALAVSRGMTTGPTTALGPLTDLDPAANAVSEAAWAGEATGLRVAVAAPAEARVYYTVDDPRFAIAPDGTVTVAGELDFETEPSVALRVSAVAADGARTSATFSLVVQDAPEYLSGTATSDRIVAGAGADWIDALGGNDTIHAGGGADTLFGGHGADRLEGGAGFDILSGDGGADRLDGGTGDDYLVGGAGADLFVFRAGSGADVIVDFEYGIDRLQFEGLTVADIAMVAVDGGTAIGTLADYVFVQGVPLEAWTAADIVFA